MGLNKTINVDAQKLRDAFEFANTGNQFDSSAWICLETGNIYWRSDATGLEDEDLPEDIEDNDQYLALPDRRELDLGQRLVLDFAAEALPGDYDTVAQFFRRQGAYGRFKGLLESRGLLARWYEFESHATDQALLAWCAEHGIQAMA